MKKKHKIPRVAASVALMLPLLTAGSMFAQQQVQPPPPDTASTTVPTGTNAPSEMDLSQPLVAPHSTRNEISFSGDYLEGYGHVTVPFGFSLGQKGSPFAGYAVPAREIGTPERQSSDYYGGTLSYSYGQAYYFDLSYENGNSTGNFPLPSTFFGTLTDPPSTFKIQDDNYQFYVRYVFPRLRGTRTFAYLRAGVTYGQTTLTDFGEGAATGYYESDKDSDIIGNVGVGVGRWMYSGSRFKFGLQLEGEGFYGHRDQTDQESVSPNTEPSVKIGNDLYGGIGRGTFRFEYKLTHSGLFRLYGDAGVEAKLTEINYGGGDYGATTSFQQSGTYNELLWGPYVKIGFRYDF